MASSSHPGRRRPSHGGSDGIQGASPPTSADLEFPEDPFSTTPPHRRRAPASAAAGQDGHQALQQPQSHQQWHRQAADPPPAESLADWAKNTRFTVLNHFSQVTNVARNGAHTLLSSPLFRPPSPDGAAYGRHGGRTAGAAVGTSLQQHGPVGPLGPGNPEWKHSEIAKKSGTGDFDSAHVYLARWAKIVAEEGESNRRKEEEAIARRLAAQQRAQGAAANADAAAASAQASSSGFPIEDSAVGPFEVWNRAPWADLPASTRQKDFPLSQEEWNLFFDEEGRPLLSWKDFRARVFERGFSLEGDSSGDHSEGGHWDRLSARAEAWSFLLGVQRWSLKVTRSTRRQEWKGKVEQYWSTKARWTQRLESGETEDDMADSAEQASKHRSALLDDLVRLKDQHHRIRVDCLRVDRKLPMFADGHGATDDANGYPSDNAHMQRLEEILLTYVIWDDSPDVLDSHARMASGQLNGYVQGMSDLCAPLYVVCGGDEAKTFWLFNGLMRRARFNFYSDQSGMRMQLSALQKLVAVLDPGLHAHLDRTDSLNIFFCYRWLLVFFKREYDFPDILRLWEAIWAVELDGSATGWTHAGGDEEDDSNDDPREVGSILPQCDQAASVSGGPTDEKPIEPISKTTASADLSDHFQIFVAFAMFEQQRDVVVKYLDHFDEILQYMNGLSGQLDVDAVLAEAQVACLSLRNLIAQQRGEGEAVPAAEAAAAAEAASKARQSKDSASGDSAAAAAAAVKVASPHALATAAAALPPIEAELCALVGMDKDAI